MSGDLLIGAFKSFENTAGKVVDSGKSVLSGILDTGAKIAGDIGSLIEEHTGIDVDGIAAKISNACEWLGNYIFEPGLELYKKTGASAVNFTAGFVKGVAEFGESILDAASIFGTMTLTSYTAIFDITNIIVNELKGEEITGETLTQKLWKETMSFVAEDHVGTVYRKFYEETKVGQWLDDKAFEPAKSDGAATNFASEIGYQAPIVVINFLTGGTAAPLTAGLAGFGRYTEESWANSRDSSWEGIERMYEKGEITSNQYESFKMIRSLSDEEWSTVETNYQQGLITQEEFETMKQIREMPDDWRTLENALNGMLYGTTNGVWEGIQWYLGIKFAGMKFATSPIGNSAIKVGIDSGFNALDTPFRTTTTAITSEKTWQEAWKEQGGWESVLINLGVGLLGSSLGEGIDLFKENKAIKKVKELIKNSDFNKKNLIEGIIKEIPDNLDDLSKARAIYLKLNEVVSYSDEYFAMNAISKELYKEELSNIYNNKFDISNLETNSIICSNWSDIYKDLLEQAGINPKKIEIIGQQGSHKFVKVDIGSGKILLADATNNINGYTDLINSKYNNETAGFVITTEKELNQVLNEIGKNWPETFRILGHNEKMQNKLAQIDKDIGYDSSKFIDDLIEISNLYSYNQTEIPTSTKINIFEDIVDKDLSSIEAFTIMRTYGKQIFGEDAQISLYVKDKSVISITQTIDEKNQPIYLYKINNSELKMTDNIEDIIEGAIRKS